MQPDNLEALQPERLLGVRGAAGFDLTLSPLATLRVGAIGVIRH